MQMYSKSLNLNHFLVPLLEDIKGQGSGREALLVVCVVPVG